MKSNKQRRQEIMARRRRKAEKLKSADVFECPKKLPLYAVAADPAQLTHNNTCGVLPKYYVDKPFVCRDCRSAEIWTAKQQRWWYEIIKGHIDSTAVRCRRCRKLRRDKKHEQKRHIEELAAKKPHPNEAFFKN